MDTESENNDFENSFEQDGPLIPEETKQASKALLLLLFYSFLMFTLPFGIFFATKYILQDTFHITGYTNTVWSVLLAVVTVNLIIVAYVYHAYHEKDFNVEEQGENEDSQKAVKQD